MQTLRRRCRVPLIALATLVTLSLIGAAYQTLSARGESVRFPPPGQLIRIADDGKARSLHLVCVGEGGPTVIFEPSAFGNALSFSQEVGYQFLRVQLPPIAARGRQLRKARLWPTARR
jgi:hypothetical protein